MKWLVRCFKRKQNGSHSLNPKPMSDIIEEDVGIKTRIAYGGTSASIYALSNLALNPITFYYNVKLVNVLRDNLFILASSRMY